MSIVRLKSDWNNGFAEVETLNDLLQVVGNGTAKDPIQVFQSLSVGDLAYAILSDGFYHIVNAPVPSA